MNYMLEIIDFLNKNSIYFLGTPVIAIAISLGIWIGKNIKNLRSTSFSMDFCLLDQEDNIKKFSRLNKYKINRKGHVLETHTDYLLPENKNNNPRSWHPSAEFIVLKIKNKNSDKLIFQYPKLVLDAKRKATIAPISIFINGVEDYSDKRSLEIGEAIELYYPLPKILFALRNSREEDVTKIKDKLSILLKIQKKLNKVYYNYIEKRYKAILSVKSLSELRQVPKRSFLSSILPHAMGRIVMQRYSNYVLNFETEINGKNKKLNRKWSFAYNQNSIFIDNYSDGMKLYFADFPEHIRIPLENDYARKKAVKFISELLLMSIADCANLGWKNISLEKKYKWAKYLAIYASEYTLQVSPNITEVYENLKTIIFSGDLNDKDYINSLSTQINETSGRYGEEVPPINYYLIKDALLQFKKINPPFEYYSY